MNLHAITDTLRAPAHRPAGPVLTVRLGDRTPAPATGYPLYTVPVTGEYAGEAAFTRDGVLGGSLIAQTGSVAQRWPIHLTPTDTLTVLAVQGLLADSPEALATPTARTFTLDEVADGLFGMPPVDVIALNYDPLTCPPLLDFLDRQGPGVRVVYPGQGEPTVRRDALLVPVTAEARFAV